MTKKLILLLTVLSLIKVSGQTPKGGKLTLIPKWSKGDVKKYQIKHSSQVMSDKLEEALRGTQNVNITVVNIKESGIDIVWKYEKNNFVDSIPSDNAFKSLMNTFTDNLTIKYTIKKNGTIESINNYDEISKIIKTRIDSIISIVNKDPKTDTTKIPSLQFYLKMMFSTNSQIDGIILNDVFKFHQLYGSTYILNTPVSLDELPITSISSRKVNVALKAIDQSTKTYRFEGVILVPGMESITKDMKTFLTYQYSNGWLKECTFSMEDIMGGARIKDNYSIKLIN